MPMKSVQVRFPEDELERIDERVEQGEYPSRAEFIRDAVRKNEMIQALEDLRRVAEKEDLELEDLIEGGKEIREQVYKDLFESA